MTERPTHLDPAGAARMVDVGDKPVGRRTAMAEALVTCSERLLAAIRDDSVEKGDLLGVARLAGIMASKRVDALIPLCHSLPIDASRIDIAAEPWGVRITASVSTTARTGVEMEALTAACVAALTVIDMGKAIDKSMAIHHVHLIEKTGGRSGDFSAPRTPGPGT